MKIRKIFFMLILIITMSTIFTIDVEASDGISKKRFEYTVEKNDEITITKYVGNEQDVIVPTRINDKLVTKIGKCAFENNNVIKKLRLPNTIREIDYGGIWFCSNLEEVVLPNSLRKMGWAIFYRCYNLKNVNLPRRLNEIGGRSFGYCTKLGTIDLPDSLSIIEPEVFMECGKDLKVRTSSYRYDFFYKEIGDKFDKNNFVIFEHGFECIKENNNEITISKLVDESEKVTIPKEIGKYKVTAIGKDAFWSCNNLKQLVMPNTIKQLNDGAIWYCYNLESVVLPSSLEKIGWAVFYRCYSLKNIEIPDTVKEIGDKVFGYCSSLEKVKLPNFLTSIGKDTFLECEKQVKISIPYDKYEYVCKQLGNKFNKENLLVCYKGIECYYINDNELCIYKYCGINEEVLIPEKINGKLVVAIGKGAFSGCNIIRKVKIPYTITRIEENAFSGCKTLEVVDMSEGLISIGKGAFYGCESMKDVIIPKTVSCIEKKESDKETAPFDSRYLKRIMILSKLIACEIFEGEFKGNIYYCDNVKLPYLTKYSNNEYLVAGCISDVCATSINFNNIRIDWKKVSPANGYYVYRSCDMNGKYEKIVTIKGNDTTCFVDEKLENNKTYYYKVKAYMSDDTWCDSNLSSETFAKTENVRPVVKSITQSPEYGLKICWDSIDNCSGYEVYCSVEDEDFSMVTFFEDKNISRFFDCRVNDGKKYRYKIRPFSIVNEKKYYGEYSNSFEYIYILDIPQNISIDNVEGQIEVKWDKNKNADGYYVYRAESIDGKYKKVAEYYDNMYTTYQQSEIDKVYYYKIQAFREDD